MAVCIGAIIDRGEMLVFMRTPEELRP